MKIEEMAGVARQVAALAQHGEPSDAKRTIAELAGELERRLVELAEGERRAEEGGRFDSSFQAGLQFMEALDGDDVPLAVRLAAKRAGASIGGAFRASRGDLMTIVDFIGVPQIEEGVRTFLAALDASPGRRPTTGYAYTLGDGFLRHFRRKPTTPGPLVAACLRLEAFEGTAEDVELVASELERVGLGDLARDARKIAGVDGEHLYKRPRGDA